jgi:hypothetical protein
MKNNNKTIRLKYIRVLEKFLTRSVAIAKNETLPFYNFKENIDRYYEEIKQVEAVRLDSEYLKMLENFVNIILVKIDTIEHDELQLLRDFILKEANILHKEKNKTNYKKDKHKYKSYNDGY